MVHSSTDSESEDDNLAKMKESVDTELLNDNLFNGKVGSNTNVSVKKASLRHQKSEDDNWIKTTPEYRAYAAKLLIKQLDPTLDTDLVNFPNNNIIPAANVIKNRVKLFKTSKKSIKIQEVSSHNVPVKRKNEIKLDYHELEKKCKSVAVDGVNILEQTEIKAWSTRSKAPVVEYVKLTDGSLLEKCTFVSIEK